MADGSSFANQLAALRRASLSTARFEGAGFNGGRRGGRDGGGGYVGGGYKTKTNSSEQKEAFLRSCAERERGMAFVDWE
ncbi:hypothetical protein NL676_029220 [Syzygium grande]|nr:hypothetical protein NL676_029220 [Syzygium grande]